MIVCTRYAILLPKKPQNIPSLKDLTNPINYIMVCVCVCRKRKLFSYTHNSVNQKIYTLLDSACNILKAIKLMLVLYIFFIHFF